MENLPKWKSIHFVETLENIALMDALIEELRLDTGKHISRSEFIRQVLADNVPGYVSDIERRGEHKRYGQA